MDEGLGYVLFRGLLLGVGMTIYFSSVFWALSRTPVYEFFYPCKDLIERIDTMIEGRGWSMAVKEIDESLRDRHLPLDSKKRLAERKVNVLIHWADESESRDRIDKLTKAVISAQEFDLGVLCELAKAKKHVAELEIRPKKLPQGARGTIHQMETSLYPLVVVYFSVEDGNGYPVGDLLAKDLEIRENGLLVREVQLHNCELTVEPVNVALCVDRSGSMKGTLASAKEGAQFFGNALSSGDLVELIAFGQKVERLRGWSRDRNTLSTLIGGIEASGNTAIYDALFFALEDFSTQNGRKAIVLLTDGKDTSSRRSLKEALAKARRMGIPIFVIGIKSAELDRETLKNIGRQSGGFYLEAGSPVEVTQLYRRIAGTLRNLYRVVYRSENHIGEKTNLTIDLGAPDPIRMQRIYTIRK